MTITANELAARAAERAENGTPETLADIIKRTRYAAEWNETKARKDAAAAWGFSDMSKDERYTETQRADAEFSAASLLAEANVRRDAARILDSIADALVHVVG